MSLLTSSEGPPAPGPAGTDNPRAHPPSLADAIIPLVALVVLIAGSLAIFGLDALDGPIQVALLLCALTAALIALKNGHSWEEIQQAAQGSLASISSAVFILLAVGALIGVWSLSGTIPTLVYYGIKLLSPIWFYAAAALICGIVAMTIGSSWTTAGTVGVGLIEVAAALGVSAPITAGAVVSGAYLGDKLSPLSETTVPNLSRLCADSGTVASPLIPWNSCGAFMGAVLGVSALRYAPFAIFCIASPVLSVLYGITGFKIERTGPPPSVPAQPGPRPDESGPLDIPYDKQASTRREAGE